MGRNYRQELIRKYGANWWRENFGTPGRPRIAESTKLARRYEGLEPAEREKFLKLIGAVIKPNPVPPAKPSRAQLKNDRA
jgi:hypothetical protein